MKVRVIRSFIDRVTGKPYNAGRVYEASNSKRIAELQQAGFLQEFAEQPAPPKQPDAPPAKDPDEKGGEKDAGEKAAADQAGGASQKPGDEPAAQPAALEDDPNSQR